jgi:hypothetical protein
MTNQLLGGLLISIITSFFIFICCELLWLLTGDWVKVVCSSLSVLRVNEVICWNGDYFFILTNFGIICLIMGGYLVLTMLLIRLYDATTFILWIFKVSNWILFFKDRRILIIRIIVIFIWVWKFNLTLFTQIWKFL